MAMLDGKVIVVTGASSGLGEATARLCAKEGASVVLAARRVEMGKAVVREIQEAGGEAIFVRTDVTVRRDVEALIDETLRVFDRVDCAVNNAGVTGPVMTPLADVEDDQWDDLMNTNLRSVFLCMRSEIPAMLEHGSGSIVNMASIYGCVGSDVGHAPYAASKHAVIGLTKSAAIDYADQGIRVNVVAPGYTHSEIVDYYIREAPALVDQLVLRHCAMNRVGDAHEVASTMAWLCSDESSFVNGAVLTIDGGTTTRLY